MLGEPIVDASPFPISLTQLSTVGMRHNQSPWIDEKQIFGLEDSDDQIVKMMRIYLDGLILHVHLSQIPEQHVTDNPIFLGSADHALMTSVTHEASFQYENMLHLLHECYPSLIEKG